MIRPRAHVPLGPLTTLGVGGEARWALSLARPEALPEALAWAEARALPVMLLGGGSNLVVSDEGFPGLVITLSFAGVERARADGDALLRVGAGHSWDALVALTVAEGLAGLECLSGIPGQVGAAPIQNIGAYGQEVGERIESVEVWDTEAGHPLTLDREACGFRYRDSRFKGDRRWIVTAITLRLQPGGPATLKYRELAQRFAGRPDAPLAEVRAAVMELRRGKSMVVDAADPNSRSAGSFFVNPIVPAAVAEAVARVARLDPPRWPAPGRPDHVKLSAAWLIERSGLPKGLTWGAVGLSARHTLALVNKGGARAIDIARLAAGVRRRVYDVFGVRLVPEPNFVGFHTSGDQLLDEITPAPLPSDPVSHC